MIFTEELSRYIEQGVLAMSKMRVEYVKLNHILSEDTLCAVFVLTSETSQLNCQLIFDNDRVSCG